jgi:energy-coupling factor transport system substrate-specific component
VSERSVAIALRPRSAITLAIASLAGLVMYCWPLLVKVRADDTVAPPLIFLALLPVVIGVVLVEFSEDGMDAKVLALLGVLTAINAVMRGISAGTAGIELVFFLMILGGRVFGAGFGFVLGCTSLLASALLTGGVGPWLPFQMMASAWVGMGAGLLPGRPRGRSEIAMLIVYGILASYAYGLVTNLMGWPFIAGIEVPGHHGGLSFIPGDPLWDNLRRFGIYTLLTSTTSFDTGRAIATTAGLLVLGPAVLTTLRRAARRALVTRTAA